MATYVQLVNSVLARMRASGVLAVADTTYAQLIGRYVNQAKREVEDAWKWQVLEAEHSFSTATGTSTYVLTNFNNRARINYVHNTTNKGRVLAVDREFLRRNKNFSDASDRQPAWYLINPQPDGDLDIEFYPVPDAVYDIIVYGIQPQDDLTNDSDVLSVPEFPVILGAYVLALAERGDDSGMAERRAQADYQSALSDAIAIDAGNNHLQVASDWVIA